MSFYIKISILAFFLGIATVTALPELVINSERSTICPSTPIERYEIAIEQFRYGCTLTGFPVAYLEEDIWGHSPRFYPSKWLLDLLILFFIFFGLLTLIQNKMKRFFETVSTVNKATQLAITLELLPVLLFTMMFSLNLPIREAEYGNVETIFDIYLYSWWPNFELDGFFLPAVVLGILFGVIGVIHEKRAMQVDASVPVESFKIKKTPKLVLYLPFLISIIWIIAGTIGLLALSSMS